MRVRMRVRMHVHVYWEDLVIFKSYNCELLLVSQEFYPLMNLSDGPVWGSGIRLLHCVSQAFCFRVARYTSLMDVMCMSNV